MSAPGRAAGALAACGPAAWDPDPWAANGRPAANRQNTSMPAERYLFMCVQRTVRSPERQAVENLLTNRAYPVEPAWKKRFIQASFMARSMRAARVDAVSYDASLD